MNRSQTWSRTAAPGEIIYSEGFAGERLIFVIADGKVEISTRCDDKKVVMATLGRGEFFGETALLGAEPRPNTAKALSFCQLTVVPASIIEDELERVSPLLRHVVRTLTRRVKAKDDLLATYTHADFMPGVLSYAHVLALIAGANDRADRADGDTWSRQGAAAAEVSVPLADVVHKCRAVAGHSRPHVMAMLRRMEKLNLIAVQSGQATHLGSGTAAAEGALSRQVVTFDPVRIVERAAQVADADLDVSINSELELIELADLETLIGVERKVILNKLSHAEIADEVFAFRKSKVLNFVEQKGVAYFSKRTNRGTGEIKALDDLLFVDQRTLFDAVSTLDTYDLAKLLASIEDQAVSERLLSVMADARKNEVSWVMRRDIKIDPVEVEDIEQRLLEAVRSLKSPGAR
ncbi:Crp/Fnr family transcriptional regulator [Paraburkholderia unamae]|uniref:Cyclic nucleotide-binding protein n=1 Tax=Paraburkholderia unamae TaxID=219649 RepID=A0ABX5KIL8_9BURK|nr:cyclic nucleotide-binding domain-containing protein [Paraburkholderia unamae]PVX78914.1 cyclic nucleotide-binding protein [Paraburkholderia unamae]RAR65022.1 cyclic nucleotide-binding protein [Paraburkholderia unamae]CAG9272819.1 Cyclic nucleotide-binding protein [Paraburkholderia unamae]